ncbi:VOC family protein [Actinomadura montaniterrae]|uniref:VOC family protein n=1 Tax=Actinomadura montaniterrae TaxID=1803903 RepID=A0A6L3VWF4_9ACTN|nr:VOC family protein [Actinomadura montaniterrae]KAB2383442.1 VOC family protein [Actinomadura montaniterrae]
MNQDVHGTQSWVDLGSPDVRASQAFYRGLFGWGSYTLTLDEFGDYEIFTEPASDQGVAGVQALVDDTGSPSWTCTFRVDDVDACVRTVEAAGGLVQVYPTPVAHLARIALFADPHGAEFGVWQPIVAGGRPPIGERSAARFVELACPDVSEAERFYGEVFGWSTVRAGTGRFATRWTVGGELVATGIVDGPTGEDGAGPAASPSQWSPYFEVADCDAATGRAVELGAGIRSAPADTELGRFSMLTDPTGVRFAVIAAGGPESRRP